MKEYGVRLVCNGGCRIRFRRRPVGLLARLRRWSPPLQEKMGFWTTRFVEAHTPSEAGERAVELVGQQLDGIIPPSATAPGITVAETWEGASSYRTAGRAADSRGLPSRTGSSRPTQRLTRSSSKRGPPPRVNGASPPCERNSSDRSSHASGARSCIGMK